MAKKRKIEIQDEEPEMTTDSKDHFDDAPEDDEADARLGEQSEKLLDQEAADETDEITAKLEKAENDAKEHYDRCLRITADFENYKKRTAREMSDLRKFANDKLLKDMLSVVDNLERAIESGSNDQGDIQKLLEGVEITLKDLMRMLENHGVKGFDSLGEAFDPNFHQAMMQEPSKDHPANTVITEMQKGYTIHERLLRPALVVVSKAAPEAEIKDENTAEEK
jgi:molecular chaperone GrpE